MKTPHEQEQGLRRRHRAALTIGLLILIAFLVLREDSQESSQPAPIPVQTQVTAPEAPIAPIASWMDPSDIGWLCESAPASEYVSTPGSARFCYTTGGERGWEQGFFGCESAPDARQRALRNNADWLQGWTRSQ